MPNSGPTGLPEPDALSRQHSDQVAALIRAEIGRKGGWISFARYMELALYAPGLGYYVAGAAKLGEAGDFVTAPELSSLFGATLALQVGELLPQAGGAVLELGAGSGRLAADLLAALQEQERLPDRYLILEISPDLAQRQRRALAERVPELAGRVEWIATLPRAFSGVILANEVLDALPIHLLAWRREGVCERGVSLEQESFGWSERPLPRSPLQDAAAAIPVQAPYLSEVSLAVPALVGALAGCLKRGVMLLIDYGFGRGEYYHPQRSQGTLMCHYRHRLHDDPFFLPGLQDITAHVDFTAVAEAGIDAGLKLLGYTTQAQFLVNAGITRLLERHSPDRAATYLPAVAAAQKLLSPAEMGELFKVIALARDIEMAPSGFAGGDKSRLL
ncbi:MAG TPA: SAM-dependent methyltransferase [Burkholderiales bacterium]